MDTLLIFHVITARLKAREAAICEALSLLRDLNPNTLPGGPLSDQKGVFWITLPTDYLEIAESRLPRLGYTHAVDVPKLIPESAFRRNTPGYVRWLKQPFRVERLYEVDEEILRERAPDKRTFMLENDAGEVRLIRGYRGDGKALSRRALPVVDACLLVNLVFSPDGGRFLDPFAGAGGVIVEAISSGYSVFSSDIDPMLRHGLAYLGANHTITNAANLPFGDATFDAIATEPPYDAEATPLVIKALEEMARVLKLGSRIALLCAREQTEALRQQGEALGLEVFLDLEINRKGTDCTVLAWLKPITKG